MFLYFTLLILIKCQDLIIWLRITSISTSLKKESLSEKFCQFGKFNIGVEYQQNFSLLIFQGYEIVYQLQIQDKVGTWVEIDIFNKGYIRVDEIQFEIKELIDQINFKQIMKNYKNWYIEIQRDQKYNNFILQKFQQKFLNHISFNNCISDSNAIITLWFKLIVDYETTNIITIKHFNDSQYRLIATILQIEKDQITILKNSNQQKSVTMNLMIWNQIVIHLQKDQVIFLAFDNHIQIELKLSFQNIQSIVNKEIQIQQLGLCIGHFSIQYQIMQFYCSPGCTNCLSNICHQCKQDQILVDNQCQCKKFYQSQNANGECTSIFQSLLVITDIYEQNIQQIDDDFFSESICPFGFTYQNSRCVQCPRWENHLCQKCINQKQNNKYFYLHCTYHDVSITYRLQLDEYVPTESFYQNNYISLSRKKKNQNQYLLLNYTQLYSIKQKNPLFKGVFVLNNQLRCPYNCDQCVEYFFYRSYCINLIEKRNYGILDRFGVPIFNISHMNNFIMNVEVQFINSNIMYIYDQQLYIQLQDIINNIDINSILFTGTYVIQFLFQIKSIEFILDNFLDQLYISIRQLRFNMQDIQQKYYMMNILIPIICVEIKSDLQFPLRLKNDAKINYFNKITITDIKFYGSSKLIEINVPRVIIKNVHFIHSDIVLNITSLDVLFQNVVFQDFGEDNQIKFLLNTNTITFINIFVTNCTLNLLQIFDIYSMISKVLIISIDSIVVIRSTINETNFFKINQLNCEIVFKNLNVQQSKLVNSNILYSETHFTSLLLTQCIFIIDSYIENSFDQEFQSHILDTLMIINCTLISKFFQFQIYQDINRGNKIIIIRNIILKQIYFMKGQGLLIIYSEETVRVSFVLIQDIITNQKNINIFEIDAFEIDLNYIQVTNVSNGRVMEIVCFFAQIFQVSVLDSQLQSVIKIKSYFNLHLDFVRIIKISKIESIIKLKCDKKHIIQNVIIANISASLEYQQIQFFQLESYVGVINSISKLLFLNNFMEQKITTIKFLQIHAPLSNIYIKKLYFINNYVTNLFGNIITIEIKELYLEQLLIRNLTLIHQKMYQINGFDLNGSIVEIINSKFQNIQLINTNLFNQKANLFELISVYLQNTILNNSKLIYISTNQIFQTHILYFQVQFLLTNDILIAINSENIRGQLNIYFSQFENIQSDSNIISCSSDITQLVIESVKFYQLQSISPIFLIHQHLKLIKIIILSDVHIENSNIGLIQCIEGQILQIFESTFTDIKFSQEFISAKSVEQIFIFQTFFSNFKLTKSIIAIELNNQTILNALYIQNSILENNNEDFISIKQGIKLIIFDIQVMNISCNCSLLSTQSHINTSQVILNEIILPLSDFLIQNNQSKPQLYVVQQQNNQYDSVNQNQIPLFNKLNYQFQSHVMLNINDQHELDKLIRIQYRYNGNVTNIQEFRNEFLYLPSGQILDQYKITNQQQLSVQKYIHKFFYHYELPLKCNLNFNQILFSDEFKTISSYHVEVNQELSNILLLQMDPYDEQNNYSIQLICQDSNNTFETEFRIKPFPCLMGEYYKYQQCNLCNIEYTQNTLLKHQNKCDYFDQKYVIQMKPGLLQLQAGFWRPALNNKYIVECQQNFTCKGGWHAGDKSCHPGYLGALCQECDIYNKRGDGSFSKIDNKCIPCSNYSARLFSYAIVIICYQLIQNYLACRRTYQYICNQKRFIQYNRYYIILNSLQTDQISICLKMLRDIYIKIILVNKLYFELPGIINIYLNIYPQQFINQGLYCNINQYGPNILVLELICILILSLTNIQISYVIYMITVYKKLIKQSVTYVATIFQYYYKSNYFYISHLLISQIIYVKLSNEQYLVGNQQYEYKFYKYITFEFIMPLFIIYSLAIPITIIFIIVSRKQSNVQRYSKIWAYLIQDYNSQCQFWEIYQLIKYSKLLFIYFYFYPDITNQLTLFIISTLLDVYIQYNIKIYKTNNLNKIQFEINLKFISLLSLLICYYQINKDYQILLISILISILIINYYIIKPIISNILRIIIVKYINYTIKYQNIIIDRYPKLIKFQQKYNLDQDPIRAQENFQKLIKLLRNRKNLTKLRQTRLKSTHKAPYNSFITDVSMQVEIEMSAFS